MRKALAVLAVALAFVAGAFYRPSQVQAVAPQSLGRYQVVRGTMGVAWRDGGVQTEAAVFLVDTSEGRVWYLQSDVGEAFFLPLPVSEPTASTKLSLPSNYAFGNSPKQ